MLARSPIPGTTTSVDFNVTPGVDYTLVVSGHLSAVSVKFKHHQNATLQVIGGIGGEPDEEPNVALVQAFSAPAPTLSVALESAQAEGDEWHVSLIPNTKPEY